MFDLENAISYWLKELRKSPGFEDGDIAEIEDHIREEIESQHSNGLTLEEALNSATSSFGRLSNIGEEMIRSRTKHLNVPHKHSMKLEFPESKNPFVNSTAMFKNFFIISIRNLSRNKLFSAVNIFGLAIGMAACLAILQYVHFEMSYDTFHENADNIYRVIYKGGNSTYGSNHPGAGPAIKASCPEVMEYARIVHQSIFDRDVSTWSYIDENENPIAFNIEDAYNVDSSFLTMFSFPFVYGDPQTAFPDVNSIVISESVAKKFFGLRNPIGETLTRDGRRLFKVTGVFKDVPENSYIKFDILYSYFLQDAWGGGWNPDYDWKWPEYYTYIQVYPNANIKNLESKFPDLIQKYLGDFMETRNIEVSFILQPLKDIHLKSTGLTHEREVHGNITTVNFLAVIAVFILVIAWINYINLSTAKATERAREVGFRKVSGASRKQLILQFLLESFSVNLFAIFIALLLYNLSFQYFIQLTGIDLTATSIFIETFFWIGLGVVLIIGSFLAGIYPAFVMSSFRITSVIKGNYFSSKGGILLRKLLVTFQFMISIALIAGTFMVYKQVSFMRNKNLGYTKEPVLVVQFPSILDSTALTKFETISNEFKGYSDIINFTVTSDVPGRFISNLNEVRKIDDDIEENIICHFFSIDYNFIDTYELKLLAGRNYRENEYTSISAEDPIPLIINEKAAQKLGFQSPVESINQYITFKHGDSFLTGVIIGVVNNFHQRSLKEDYDALMFGYFMFGINYFCLKLNSTNIHETVEYVEKSYKDNFPGNPFEYFFQDDYFDTQYASDKKFGKIFGIFSLLAIFVASLGLFGLTTYMISRRTKEIAIRKVLGATVQQLLLLFSKDFIRLIIIASLIALPIFYYFGNNWLKIFTFRIHIGWLMFVLPLIILLVITMVTISIQTIKTSMINPADTLKHE